MDKDSFAPRTPASGASTRGSFQYGTIGHQERNEKLLSSGTLKGILQEVLHCILAFTKADKGNIQLASIEDRTVSIAVHQGHGEAFLRHFSGGGTKEVSEATFLVQRLMILEDVEKGILLRGTRDLAVILEDGVRALESMPLIGRGGEMYGRLTLCYSTPHRSSEVEIKRLELLSRIVINLIERMFVEQAHRESEAHLAAVFSAAEVGLSELTLDGRFLKVNDTICRMLGRTREDLLSSNFAEMTYPDDLEITISAVSRLSETGDPVSVDKRYQRPDGSVVWVNSKLSLLQAGKEPIMLAVTVDLTRRMLAEKGLRESELRIRKLFEQAPGFLLILRGTDHVFEFVNEAFLRLIGHDRHIIGKTFREAFPEITGQGFFEVIDSVYETGRSVTAFEKPLRFLPQSGESAVTRYLDYVNQPITDVAGNITGVFVEGFDVTDRVLSREALKASERLYSTLFNKIDEGFCILKKVHAAASNLIDFRFQAANPAMSVITGTGDVTGRTIREAFPLEPQEWFDIFEQVLATGTPIHFERSMTTNGALLELYAFPLEDSENQLGVIFQDITVRKRAEEALREREEHQAFLLKLSDSLQPLHPPGLLQQACCRELATYFKVERAYYLETDLQDLDLVAGREYNKSGVPDMVLNDRLISLGPLWKARLREGAIRIIPDVSIHPEIGESEKRILTRDCVHAFIQVPLLKNGSLAAIVGLDSQVPRQWREGEITLLREAAGRILTYVDQSRYEQALTASEERFRAIVSQTAAGIWMSDSAGKLLFANQKLVEMLGYNEGELTGKALQQILQPGGTLNLHKQYEEMMKEKRPLETEITLVRKDGSSFWSRISIAPLSSAPDVPQTSVAVVLDISERKALEKLKDEFIAVASHELKTPVTSIKGYAEMLRGSLQETKDESNALLAGKLDGQVDRLISLIRDLLDTSKIAEGQLSLRPEIFDLNELILERVAELQQTAPLHQVTFTPGDLKPIEADRDRVGQVLNNLVSNAIRYSPAGGPVHLKSFDNGNSVQISVEDKGLGIPVSLRDKLFDRFFRVSHEGSATFPGMGLGLYISAEIVKHHGGTITLEGEEGKGTTFLVNLPYHSEGATT